MTKRGKKIYYISGFQIAQAKAVCIFFFGDYLHSIKLNENDLCFDIIVKKEIGKLPLDEVCDLDYFKDYWGKQWRLKYEPTESI